LVPCRRESNKSDARGVAVIIGLTSDTNCFDDSKSLRPIGSKLSIELILMPFADAIEKKVGDRQPTVLIVVEESIVSTFSARDQP